MTRILTPALFTPALWIIVLLVGLPQLSETVYTPSLPNIAHTLRVSESWVEYTLTIYLFGFAVGTLFWGQLSDTVGRKPCILAGLFIFVLGCIGCYFSSSIMALMLSRFIQAFGGSIGSVLGQAVCRDAFQGPALGRVYSSMGSALAIFPAIGPIIGGGIAENFGWPIIFLFLLSCGIILSAIVFFRLPETHHPAGKLVIPGGDVVRRLMRDKKAMGYGLIVAACNGINFSYFAEGPFYFIERLGLSPSQYGASFIAIACSMMMGGILSRKLQAYRSSQTIMGYGIKIIALGSAGISLLVIGSLGIKAPNAVLIFISLGAQMMISLGIAMATGNALALALGDYKECIGTASSVFGFFYYCLITLFTLGMGTLHNGTLLPMPLYFCAIGIFMEIIRRGMLTESPLFSKG